MWIKKVVKSLLGMNGESIENLRKRGVKIGEDVELYSNEIDYGHGYLLEIGSHVTITHSTLLTHDASTKRFLGYSKVGKVKIGDNVFIGHGTVVQPGVTIGNNVIVGAGSIVRRDIPDNSLAAGNPAEVLCSLDEYIGKHRERMKINPVYNTYWADKTDEEKQIMIRELDGKIGYDI